MLLQSNPLAVKIMGIKTCRFFYTGYYAYVTGNKSLFIVMLSMEVNEGTLSTTLPVNLVSTSELKIQGGNQWQPLQTFVTISNHFVLKGKGIRFRGTISDCNSAIQQLYYQVSA